MTARSKASILATFVAREPESGWNSSCIRLTTGPSRQHPCHTPSNVSHWVGDGILPKYQSIITRNGISKENGDNVFETIPYNKTNGVVLFLTLSTAPSQETDMLADGSETGNVTEFDSRWCCYFYGFSDTRKA